jgi:polyhydroxyalkanoate synthesis regulator phasin
MPQPKKPASSARKPAAAKKPAARGAAKARGATATGKARVSAARGAAAKLNDPASRTAPARARAAKPKPRPKAAKVAAAAPAPDELVASLGALRERLVSSLTLTSDRLQEAVDDAVRRGRMTRKDAEELLGTLVAAGRAQTEAILADVEQLLGRGGSDAVLRTVDRARRKVGVGAFPILGYEDLTAAQVAKRLTGLTPAQLRKVRDFERRHGARKSVLSAVERKLG